ncbi:MAG: Flp pilus assembly protein CpaB, partial [Pseudomonadota bacterium]
PANVEWRTWPKSAVSDGFISEDEGPTAMEDRIGSIAAGFILAGEPIVDAKIVKVGDGPFLSALLTPGMRAVSVEISEETAAAGFILPGDRVDVILTREQDSRDGSRSDDYRSETILSNLRVLAVDQKFNKEGDQEAIVGGTATLEATLGQSEALRLAQARGDVSLVLRSLSQPDGAAPEIEAATDGAGPRLKIIRYGQVSQTSGAQ